MAFIGQCSGIGPKECYNTAMKDGNLCAKCEIKQLQAETKTYKAGNVPVTHIIADNEAIALRIEELEEGNKNIQIMQKKLGILKTDNEQLQERIELAIDELPECPNEALSFLKPVMKGET